MPFCVLPPRIYRVCLDLESSKLRRLTLLTARRLLLLLVLSRTIWFIQAELSDELLELFLIFLLHDPLKTYLRISRLCSSRHFWRWLQEGHVASLPQNW